MSGTLYNMQENNDILVELSEPQAAVLECRQSTILDMSGQGGGKSALIAYDSGNKVAEFPEALGFIGANTHMQLSQSTIVRVFNIWRQTYGFTKYDKKRNPQGAFVIDRTPPPHFQIIHEMKDYDGIITFWNGATIFTGSLTNYEAHDGKEFAWAHLDETKDTEEKALTDVIMGRLRQYGLWFNLEGEINFNNRITPDQAARMGWKSWNPLYIHTSPAGGSAPWLNRMFKLDGFAQEIRNAVEAEERDYFYKEFENKAVCIYSAYHNQHNLPPDYFEKKKQDYNQDSAKILKLIHGYPFSKTGGEYYPYWNRDLHVGNVPYLPGLPVHISWDFNVVPYMTCICAQLQFITKYIDRKLGIKYDTPAPGLEALEVMRIRVYKGYFLESPRNSTEAVCEAFAEDHDPNVTEVLYYGDASGNNRIPGLGAVTNYKIIADKLFQFTHNSSKQVQIPNIGIGKRRDFMNDLLNGKYPELELIIDDSLEELKEDMEQTKQGPNGKAKEKSKDENTGEKFEKRGHPSDALEYLVTKICKHYLTL
jgi:hypothetical protein